MRVMFIAMVSGLAVLVSGCAQYVVVGQFEDTGQPFFGRVEVSLTDSGSLDVQTADGQVQCSGTSKVTAKGSVMSASGVRGSAEATCNDGRSFKVDFVQTSASGGHGQGIDNRGNIVKVYFDMSESAARAQLDQAYLNSLVR